MFADDDNDTSKQLGDLPNEIQKKIRNEYISSQFVEGLEGEPLDILRRELRAVNNRIDDLRVQVARYQLGRVGGFDLDELEAAEEEKKEIEKILSTSRSVIGERRSRFNTGSVEEGITTRPMGLTPVQFARIVGDTRLPPLAHLRAIDIPDQDETAS